MNFHIDWSQYPKRLYELLTGAIFLQQIGHIDKARKMMNEAYTILDQNKLMSIRYSKQIGRIILINN